MDNYYWLLILCKLLSVMCTKIIGLIILGKHYKLNYADFLENEDF